MNLLKDLKHIAKDFTLLYVEDNKALRDKAKILLEKFFNGVDLASDGKIGLEMFKKKHYSIVITDIKMPHMDGITLSKYIKKIKPETKIIIMSAFDDKDLLFQGIELGIFRFLTKPVNVTELAEVLQKAILEIRHEQNTKMFYSYLKNIFEYQSSMVVMLHDKELVLANDIFLEFFGFECMSECKGSLLEIAEQFLPHDSFLYNSQDTDAVDKLLFSPQKLFHIKLKSSDETLHHFIIKYQDIPEKEGYGILSFDDVTELNLLALFDASQSKKDAKILNTKAMYNLLEVIQRNSSKVDIHNYYKGLSITNSAVITEIRKESIVLRTSYIQLKAIQLEQKAYIYSSALPHVVEAKEVVKMSFEKQEVELKFLAFVHTSPIQRATIRVVPSDKQTVSLFLGANKFHGDIEIEDISLDAIKLKLSALPAGLDEDSEIVLELDKKPLIINTKASMLRKSESKYSFSVVFMLKS